MAVLTGVNGELLINGITVAKCRSFSLNQQRDAIEVTPLGDEWRTYVSGLKGATGSASCYDTPTGTKLRWATWSITQSTPSPLCLTVVVWRPVRADYFCRRFASVGDARPVKSAFRSGAPTGMKWRY